MKIRNLLKKVLATNGRLTVSDILSHKEDDQEYDDNPNQYNEDECHDCKDPVHYSKARLVRVELLNIINDVEDLNYAVKKTCNDHPDAVNHCC